MAFNEATVGLLALLGALLGLGSTIFWMVVGWRALQTFERIAESVETMSTRDPQSGR